MSRLQTIFSFKIQNLLVFRSAGFAHASERVVKDGWSVETSDCLGGVECSVESDLRNHLGEPGGDVFDDFFHLLFQIAPGLVDEAANGGAEQSSLGTALLQRRAPHVNHEHRLTPVRKRRVGKNNRKKLSILEQNSKKREVFFSLSLFVLPGQF